MPTFRLNYLLKVASRTVSNCNITQNTRYLTTSRRVSDSVSTDEVNKFSNFADTWWDENGHMKALHQMNSLRVPFIRDGLLHQGHGKMNCSKPLQGVNLLDVGCGAGILSEPLARIGASVLGIDANDEAIEAAKTHRGNNCDLSDLQYLDILLEDVVAVGSLKFDCVVASEVLEHVENQKEFIKLCADALKPGGSLFISTINRTFLSYTLGILLSENILGIVPPGTHDWNKFVNPDDLTSWMNEANLNLQKLHGLTYIPGVEKWSWTGSTDISYILHAVKFDENISTHDEEPS